ncbi:S6 family peptidase [uncultured Helicobacter sp.]|uniref:autotransporter outer membrane beta-barrel domain-containing protein n=1 Tax=uncultured Helicobacter sp. TaxID=175537 RepID=UPI00374EFD13
MIGYESQGATRIEGSNVYHTGGLLELRRVDVPFVLEMHAYDWDNANLRIPFGSSSAPGDSGSALYVYDNVDKSWYVVGVVSQSDCSGQTGDGCSYVYYTLVNDELIKEFKELKSVFVGGGTYRFDNTGSLLDSSGMDLKASVISGSGAGENLWNSLFNKSAYDNRLNQMKNSKDLYFSDSGSLSLEKDIDLGAGVLVFGKDSNWSVSGTNNTNTWFLHGGIYADSGARITYDVSTKENDFLHKLGEGTLIVTSSSADAGLRIGQGLVELKGNALSFKELYFVSGRGELKLESANNINTDYVYFGARGGKLDMNGQNLSFKRIYASDNGANIINSSQNLATLTLQNTQDYLYHGNIISDSGGINIESSTSQNLIFDGNINNANGKMTFSNGSLTFQGHPTIHAYVSEEVKEKLDSMSLGEGVFTSPTSFSQGDWEHRNFSLQSLKLENATFNIARNATLKTNIYATDSTLSLGTSTLWRDENDGENVGSALIATGNEQFYAGNEQYEGVGNDMKFNQNLKQGTIADFAKGQVLFVGDMHLSNSNATLNAMSFVGNIESNSGTSKLTITDSTLQGNITGTSTLSTQDSFISGVVSTSTLNANNTTFNLQVDVAKNTAQSLESTQSTSGGNNTLLLHLLNAPSSSTKLPSLLLASLQDSNKNLNKGYFSIPDIQDGFSIYTPNVAFTHEGDKAQWSLEQINVAQNSYFNISENTESTKRANALFNQVLLGYVIEWNNLQKRMGELRENPKAAGAWIRSFGGGSSDDKYRGNFFETQLGSDYQLDFNAGKIYLGGMFSYTRNAVQGVGANAQSNGYGLGAYVSTFFDNGLYFDSILRYIYKEHTIDASFIPSGAGGVNVLHTNSGSNTLLFSLEGGYRLNLSDFFTHRAFRHFYLEPQLELITGYLQGAKWQNENVSLELKDSAPVSVKPALFVGKRFFFATKNIGMRNAMRAHPATCAMSSRTPPRALAQTPLRDSPWQDSTQPSCAGLARDCGESKVRDSKGAPAQSLDAHTKEYSIAESYALDSHTRESPSTQAMMSDCLTPQDLTQSLGVRWARWSD